MTTTTPDRDLRVSTFVATEVRILLARQNIKPAELARRLGVSAAWLSRRINGHVDFEIDTLASIAIALGDDPRRLILDSQAAWQAAGGTIADLGKLRPAGDGR